MKHYFGATADGRLHWTFVYAGGFEGTTCDLEAATPTDPLATHLLNVHNKNQTSSEVLDCVVVYTCPCDPSVSICDCAPTKRLNAYCNSGVLTDKPLVDLVIDGITVTSGDTVTKYPNQLFTVKLVSQVVSSIPDGETATLATTSLSEAPLTTLTFTSDQTNEVTLRAPAQGVQGHFTIIGKMVCHYRVFIKGFAAT